MYRPRRKESATPVPITAELGGRNVQLAEIESLARFGSWHWDLRTNAVAWSDELYRISGYSRRKLPANFEGLRNLVHKDDHAVVDEVIRRAIDTGEPFHLEHRIVWPDGRVRLISSRGSIAYNAAGKAVRMYGIARDITERKEIEDALRASEERFRLIAENASDLIAVLDTDGRRLYSSPSYNTLFDNPDALRGTDSFKEIHPADRDRIRRVFEDTVRTGVGRRAEFRFVLENGEHRFIESQGNAIRDSDGCVTRVLVVSRDVTERRMADEALRARELQLREAQTVANLGIWEWDMQQDSIIWSDQLYRIFGRERGEFVPKLGSVIANIHPDDQERCTRAAQRTLSHGDNYDEPYRIVRPDGTIRIIYSHGHVDRDANGKPVRMFGVCLDVTERQSNEEKARASEERMRMMVEHVRDYAIIMLDPAGLVTNWNLGAERINGYRAEEIIGRHFSNLYPPERTTLSEPSEFLQRAMVEGRHEEEGWCMRKDGTRFRAHVTITPVYDERGSLRGFSKITHDITERKRTEEDLRSYADRLRATSRRLAEVQESERQRLAMELHDLVGQNLTAIGINLSLISGRLPPEVRALLADPIADCASLVQATVDATRHVTGELRPPVLDDYGLPAALRSHAARFSKRTGIRITFESSDDPLSIPRSVELAFFRIAQEALNNIAKHSGSDRAHLALFQGSDRLVMEIEDTGRGFNPKQIEIAHPTAGWGLLIMRERAEAAGAHFKLDADPGFGVSITVEYQT